MFREEKRQSTHDYEPFGVEIPPYNESASNSHKFTGHERDATTGYDYMHFRYYASTIGRFMKPDNVLGDLANPQSFNRYSYVRGNPVNMNDPTGHLPATYYRDGIEVGTIGLNSGTVGATGVSSGIDLGVWTWRNQAIQNLHSLFGIDARGHEMAMLVGATYDIAKQVKAGKTTDFSVPVNWCIKDMNIDRVTGLDAVLFYNGTTKQYVLAFAGTNELRDWKASLAAEFIGCSEQYAAAYRYTQYVMETYSPNITLAGHSLGGGEVGYLAVRFDLHGYTFNASGINSSMIGGQAGRQKALGLITAYHTSGDPLTGAQYMTPLANSLGRNIYIGRGGHGIEYFINAPVISR